MVIDSNVIDTTVFPIHRHHKGEDGEYTPLTEEDMISL